MRKWDDDCRLRNYVTKILNAKPVVQQGTTKMMQKISRETDFSSNASCRSNKSDLKDFPLYKQYIKITRQLQEYNLQQYANKLMLRGYGAGLQQLAVLTLEYQNSVFDELKLLPGHKKKFFDLFKYLIEHPHDLNHNSTKPLFTPDHQTLNKRIGNGQVSFGRFSNTKELHLETLKPINRRNSQKHYSPYRDESSQPKPKVLPKLPKKSSNIKNTLDANINKVNEYDIQQQSRLDTVQQLNKSVGKSGKKTQELIYIPNQDSKIKSKIKNKTSQDDRIKLNLVTKKQAINIKDNKLFKNLRKIIAQNDQTEGILQMDQIKMMYQSFDNGKLASTLINLDIEEICNCLASLIYKQLVIIDKDDFIYDQPEFQKINHDCNAKPLDNQYLEYQEPIQEQTFEVSRPEYLKQEVFETSNENFQQYDDQFEDQVEYNEPDVNLENQQYEEQDPYQEQESKQLYNHILSSNQTKSYFSVETTQIYDDKELFDKVFTDQTLREMDSNMDTIQNYCKNIIITTKMEREVAIISLVYLDRLTSVQDIRITNLNWQRSLFTALVISSKIWDDESFENNNFSKVLPQFSTLQINEMEKIFLKLINYNLYIKQGDYAKCYFILRTFADKKKRSYQVKQLDLKTVLFLQKKVEQQISKTQYINPLNKSF